MYKRARRNHCATKVEQNSASLALTPLVLAERDRNYLKQLVRVRSAEEKLMADVEGWEVGTWYGNKVYKTLNGKWIDPNPNEYYIHCSNHQRHKASTHVNWIKLD